MREPRYPSLYQINTRVWLTELSQKRGRFLCQVRLPFADLAGKKWWLRDQLGKESYAWNGDDLQGHGLYLDMAPWQACVFEMCRAYD